LALVGRFVGVTFVGSAQVSTEPAPRDTAIGHCVDIYENSDPADSVIVVDCSTPHNGKLVSA
jgi:hypothetical protein